MAAPPTAVSSGIQRLNTTTIQQQRPQVVYPPPYQQPESAAQVQYVISWTII